MFTDLQIPAGRRPLSAGEKSGIAATSLVVTALMAAALLEDYEPRKLGPVFFILSWVPLLVLHELGHAVAAWLVGWRVSRIVIGVGPELWRGRIGHTDVRVHLVAISGYILPAPQSRDRFRMKDAFVYAAGPGSEFLLLGALLLIFGSDSVFNQSAELPLVALKALTWAIILGGGFNLVPLPINGMATDGLGIWRAPFLTDREIEARLAAHDCDRVARLLDEGAVEEALSLCRESLARFPEVPALLFQEVEVLAAKGNLEAADGRVGALLEREDLQKQFPKEWAAELWLLRARVELQSPEASSMAIDQALNKAEAHGVNPIGWMIAKGATLVERGLFESGGNLLVNAFRRLGEGDGRTDGEILAWLAIAARQAGDRDAAERFYEALAHCRPPRWLKAKADRAMGG